MPPQAGAAAGVAATNPLATRTLPDDDDDDDKVTKQQTKIPETT